MPIYNALVGLFTVLPWAGAGLAVILITVLVRLVLYPLSKKAVVAQVEMQRIGPELEKIKEKYKDNQEEQARQTLALYKKKGVNPFSGFLVIIIQLPIIWALYRVFINTGFPHIDSTLLYTFVHAPSHISTIFLGIDLTHKSVILAALAALATHFQLRIATARMPKPDKDKASFSNDLSRSMQMQMKYIFPVIVFLIAYKISGVIALYWLTTNLFTIGQEIVVRRKLTAKA